MNYDHHEIVGVRTPMYFLFFLGTSNSEDNQSYHIRLPDSTLRHPVEAGNLIRHPAQASPLPIPQTDFQQRALEHQKRVLGLQKRRLENQKVQETLLHNRKMNVFVPQLNDSSINTDTENISHLSGTISEKSLAYQSPLTIDPDQTDVSDMGDAKDSVAVEYSHTDANDAFERVNDHHCVQEVQILSRNDEDVENFTELRTSAEDIKDSISKQKGPQAIATEDMNSKTTVPKSQQSLLLRARSSAKNDDAVLSQKQIRVAEYQKKLLEQRKWLDGKQSILQRRVKLKQRQQQIGQGSLNAVEKTNTLLKSDFQSFQDTNIKSIVTPPLISEGSHSNVSDKREDLQNHTDKAAVNLDHQVRNSEENKGESLDVDELKQELESSGHFALPSSSQQHEDNTFDRLISDSEPSQSSTYLLQTENLVNNVDLIMKQLSIMKSDEQKLDKSIVGITDQVVENSPDVFLDNVPLQVDDSVKDSNDVSRDFELPVNNVRQDLVSSIAVTLPTDSISHSLPALVTPGDTNFSSSIQQRQLLQLQSRPGLKTRKISERPDISPIKEERTPKSFDCSK